MRIIKPYGKSITTPARRLLDNKEGKHEVPQFAKSKDRLVIAQWVSILDKIIRSGKFRKELFEKSWALMCAKGLILNEESGKKLWDAKAACKKCEEGQEKGRYYNIFVQGSEDATATAKKVYTHLYKNVLSPKHEHSKGLIEHRANSISENILLKKDKDKVVFSDNTKKIYKERVGKDIAAEILSKINDKTKEEQLKLVMDTLYEAYGKVFGENRKIADMQEEEKKLFALHQAIKDSYLHILRRKNPKRQDKTYLFPCNIVKYSPKLIHHAKVNFGGNYEQRQA